MRIALFADVHANAPALEAVLRAIRAEAPDATVFLGDLVGYNAQPAECIDAVRAEASVAIAGNHDRDVSRGAVSTGTNSAARAALDWTREHLDPERLAYLTSLPTKVVGTDGFVGVHGCFLNDEHVRGYVTGTMLEANLRTVAQEHPAARVAFCGHTHVPMCGWLQGNDCVERRLADDLVEWPASARVALVNPGSVGQPRDHDPRAAFAIVDLARRTVELRRVEYDVARTMRALRDAALPASLAVRLREGR